MHARINNRVSVREKDKGIKKEQNALRPQMTMMRREKGASASIFSRRFSSKPAIVMGVSGELSTNA